MTLADLPWVEYSFGTRYSTVPEERLAFLKQIHSARVLRAIHPGLAGEGDALVTDRPALLVGVRTADCFPILLADTSRPLVAAVHAGWRGVAGGIATKTIQAMGSNPADIAAAIGPGIGACCYEVGPEVAEKLGLPAATVHADLARTSQRQLLDAGVPAANVAIDGRCTRCLPDLFHSYRRDGVRAGRMFSYIGIRA